jgi:hypothetical protein
MSWLLQTPHQQSPKTLAVIVQHCSTATSGGAAFAFASASGVALLEENPAFRKFIGTSPFTIVLGLDAITDTKAVAAIRALAEKFPKLTAKFFLHDNAGTIFHPKTIWFRKADGGGTVITGSGNLTTGGLRSNWEALHAITLDAAGIDAVEKNWASWLADHKLQLLDPGDPTVVEKAKSNRMRRTRIRKALQATTDADAESLIEAAGEMLQPLNDKRFLIAEVPKSGNRWNQVNFDMKTYQGFFGVSLGKGKDVTFREVRADGTLEAAEQRHGVAVKSQNYRFEVGAAKGLAYPVKGNPIVVFERVTDSNFHYLLLMPDMASHGLVQNFIDSHYPKSHQKRRETISEAELEDCWPDCPLLS